MLRTPVLDAWNAHLDELAERAADLAPTIVKAVLDGGGHEYLPFAGQSAGLVSAVLPAEQIVHDAVRDAARILSTPATSPPTVTPAR